jgi:hypothetical protein
MELNAKLIEFYSNLYLQALKLRNISDKNLFYNVHRMRCPEQIETDRHIFEDAVLYGNCALVGLIINKFGVSVSELEKIFGDGINHPLSIASSADDFDMVDMLKKLGFRCDYVPMSSQFIIDFLSSINEDDLVDVPIF